MLCWSTHPTITWYHYSLDKIMCHLVFLSCQQGWKVCIMCDMVFLSCRQEWKFCIESCISWCCWAANQDRRSVCTDMFRRFVLSPISLGWSELPSRIESLYWFVCLLVCLSFPQELKFVLNHVSLGPTELSPMMVGLYYWW